MFDNKLYREEKFEWSAYSNGRDGKSERDTRLIDSDNETQSRIVLRVDIQNVRGSEL